MFILINSYKIIRIVAATLDKKGAKVMVDDCEEKKFDDFFSIFYVYVRKFRIDFSLCTTMTAGVVI